MAKNRSLSITLALLVVAFAAAATVSGLGGGGGMVGGRTKVSDVKTNQEIQDLGRYSMEQYNHQQQKKNGGGDLKFQSVVEAETQVVAGVKYFLKISAADRNGASMTFDAVVLVKPWLHSKELMGFSPSLATK